MTQIDASGPGIGTFDGRYVALAPTTTTRNVITAPTATSKALVLKTTDDNTTNKLFQVQTSGAVETVGIDAVGQMALTASGTTRTPLTITAAASHGTGTS